MADMKVEILETQGTQGYVTPETQKPKDEVKKPDEPKYVRIEDLEKVNQAINNTREYNNRQLSEIKDAIARLTPKPVEPKTDDLDELVQKDWKAGVKAVVTDVIKDYQRVATVQTEEQKTAALLEESKKKVMTKHPELSNPQSPKAIEFLKVLDENPDFKSNPRGPLLAAYEMENRLKVSDSMNSGDKALQKEARARASAIPSGTSPGNKGSYSLSKTDMDFCRLNNINPENYKKFKGMKEAQIGG